MSKNSQMDSFSQEADHSNDIWTVLGREKKKREILLVIFVKSARERRQEKSPSGAGLPHEQLRDRRQAWHFSQNSAGRVHLGE